MNRRKFLKSLAAVAAGSLIMPGALVRACRERSAEPVKIAVKEIRGRWEFATGDELTRKVWAKTLWREVQRESYLRKFLND